MAKAQTYNIPVILEIKSGIGKAEVTDQQTGVRTHMLANPDPTWFK